MSIETLRSALPPFAKDIADNLDAVLAEKLLTEQQKWGCVLACVYSIGATPVLSAVEKEASERLSAAALSDAKSAAAIMAMNTVYYGAIHLLSNHEYRNLPAMLRMSTLAHPSVDKIDFELWALAVSALTGCAACLNTHEAELHKRDIPVERIQAALRIAAVMNAVSVVMRAEAAKA